MLNLRAGPEPNETNSSTPRETILLYPISKLLIQKLSPMTPAKLSFTSVLLLLVTLLGAACSIHPGGLSSEQWNALPQSERDRITREDRARINAYIKGSAPSASSIAAAHANAHYGDVVRVTLERGMLVTGDSSKAISPITVDLVKNEQVEVPIRTPLDTGNSISVRLSEDGNSVLLEGYEACGNFGWDTGHPVWAEGKEYQPKERAINYSHVKDLRIYIQYKRF